MSEPANLDKLDELLQQHVTSGHMNKVVFVCHTGPMSGLVAGVLGTLGFNSSTLRFGFEHPQYGWKAQYPAMWRASQN